MISMWVSLSSTSSFSMSSALTRSISGTQGRGNCAAVTSWPRSHHSWSKASFTRISMYASPFSGIAQPRATVFSP